MVKILFWTVAAAGILFLLGLGVELMPTTQSWLWSGIAWGAALLWLFGVLFYWLRHKKRVEFYSQRQRLEWFRKKVKSARIVWGAYLIGGSIDSGEVILKAGNFKRLVLLHPDSEAVKAIKEMESVNSLDHLQGVIRKNTNDAKKQNCDVRWCQDITYNLLTIGNPPELAIGTPPDDMWVLVEAYVPGIEADKRPSFLVKRTNNQELTDSLLISFTKLWEHSKPAISPPIPDMEHPQRQ